MTEDKLITLKQFDDQYQYDPEKHIVYSTKYTKKHILKTNKGYWTLFNKGKQCYCDEDTIKDFIKYPDLRAVDLIPKKSILIDHLDVNFEKLPPMHTRFTLSGKSIKGWTREEINNAMRTKPLVMKEPIAKPVKNSVITNDSSIIKKLDKQKNIVILVHDTYLEPHQEFNNDDYRYLWKHQIRLADGTLKDKDMQSAVLYLSANRIKLNGSKAKVSESLSGIKIIKGFVNYHYSHLLNNLYNMLNDLLDSNHELSMVANKMTHGEDSRYQRQLRFSQRTTHCLIQMIKSKQNERDNVLSYLDAKKAARTHEAVRANKFKINNYHEELNDAKEGLRAKEVSCDKASTDLKNKTNQWNVLRQENAEYKTEIEDKDNEIKSLKAKLDQARNKADQLAKENNVPSDNQTKQITDYLQEYLRNTDEAEQARAKEKAEKYTIKRDDELTKENDRLRAEIANLEKEISTLKAYKLVVKDLIK